MMNKMMMMTAVAAFMQAAGAKAQYYNFAVTVHQAPQPPFFSELIASEQMINQQNTLDFRNRWVYQISNGQRAFWVRAVPGLGAAIVHGDWNAAWSFWSPWIAAEMAHEKRYHQPSPAYKAAYNATFVRTTSRKHK
jgi:hypothetical protein